MAWCGQATHAIRNWDALFFQCLKERYTYPTQPRVLQIAGPTWIYLQGKPPQN